MLGISCGALWRAVDKFFGRRGGQGLCPNLDQAWHLVPLSIDRVPFCYEHPRPALSVDCVVLGFDLSANTLKLVLIKRGIEPFAGDWALPGGFVHIDETLEEAARRELSEETGLTDIYLEQLYTFGECNRDPRERVVSVAYFALVRLQGHRVQGATDASEAAWFDVNKLPQLAFDHSTVLETAMARLKGKVRYQPIGFELLPAKFTLGELQRLYEIILERPLDKRNFRKKVLAYGILVRLDEVEQGVSHRAARLYRFDKRKYQQLQKSGFDFEV